MPSKHKVREWFSDVFRSDGKVLPWGVKVLPSKDPIRNDPRLSLDFKTIGCRGSHFVLADSTHYLRRHVETVQIMSDAFARRRLTIDIQLPADSALGETCENGDVIFWIPVTSITKSPPRSNIDLRDDHGRAVALLTRRENGLISQAALIDAAAELLDGPPPPLLTGLLRETVECDKVAGEVACVLAEAALIAADVDMEKEDARAFTESLRVLAGNAWAWVPFRGRPGERRVIKFHYDIEFERPALFRVRPKTHRYLVVSGKTKVAVPLQLRERGDGNPYSPPRRLAARVASSTGLGAVNLGIESPYLVASDSYHLQVESPPGVETRDIDLFAELQSEADVDNWRRSHGIHLYVNRARLKVEGAGLALVTLRVGRRGFMTLSWLSVVLSAALLWLFDLTAKTHIESREATATVLLFGPALLAALVVRPGEHPVATKLFSGVRLLVALNGLLAVAAAAAVADVRPDGWSIEHAWFVYAIAASAVAALVSVSWILSWDGSYRVVSQLRKELSSVTTYRRTCAALVSITGLVLLLGGLDVGLPEGAGVYVGVLVTVGLACAFASASYARVKRPPALLAWLCVSFAALATGVAAANMVMNLTADWDWEALWLGLAVGALLATIALVIQDRIRHRNGMDSPPTNGDGERIENGGSPLGRLGTELTPSAERVRRQARKAGTGFPDLLAPSAYHEVEAAEELLLAGREMYAALLAGPDAAAAANGHGDSAVTRITSKEHAEQIAAARDRELIFFDV